MSQSSATTNVLGGAPANEVAPGDSAPHSVFIAEHSLGSLLRNSVALYRANFRALFFTYVLPTFPFLVLQQVGQFTQNTVLFLGALILGVIANICTIGAITITIADICLGNSPSVRRSYRRVFQDRLWLSVLLTSTWQMIVMAAGLLLLVVPGLILSVRFLFTPTVVVLERLSGNAALKRSFNLSRGHFWRLWGAVIMLFVVFWIAPVALAAIASGGVGFAMAEYVHSEHVYAHLPFVLVISLAPLLIYPLFFVGIVLLYYDLRVRKEAYDVVQLSEDMMR